MSARPWGRMLSRGSFQRGLRPRAGSSSGGFAPGPRFLRGLPGPGPRVHPKQAASGFSSRAFPAQAALSAACGGIHLAARTRGLPPAAPFLAAQKWGKKPPAPFGLDPRFCPIGHLQRGYPVATEILRACRSFVIGALHYALRLTALESMVVSFFAYENLCVPTDADGPVQKTDGSIPLRWRQPKPDKQPGGDQMPKGADSVAAQRQNLIPSDWTKESKTLVLALFRFTFVRTKVNPGFGAGEAPIVSTRGPGARSPQTPPQSINRPQFAP